MQKLFKTDTPFTIDNKDVYNSMMVKYFWYSFARDIHFLYKRKVPLIILNGHYDGICNPKYTHKWIRILNRIRRRWNRNDWKLTKLGKVISFENFSYEIVNNSPHCVGLQHPELITAKINELIQE